MLLTSRGRDVAVVQSVNDYESAEEERTFMRAIVLRELTRPPFRIVYRPDLRRVPFESGAASACSTC